MKNISDAVKQKWEQDLWTVFACSFLSMWLIFSHFAFGYKSYPMIVSDITTGIIVLIASMICIWPTKLSFVCKWVICLCGIWLNFAPLIFYAKIAVEYVNNTSVGILLILFSLIIPGIPGKIEEEGNEIPPGWSHNPSSWLQRIPVIKLAIFGMFISRYLACYQLGYIDHVFDPVFGGESVKVLTSSVAKYFPVPDAGLGCFAYTLEALLGLKGGPARWRTMPWMVVSFVMLVVPLGIISIMLVVMQPLIVGAWCFLCLCTAFAMMIMIVYAVDELFAVFQFLHLSTKAGNGFWKTFFHGGDIEGTKDAPQLTISQAQIFELKREGAKGITFSWTLLLSAALGGFTMLFPYLFFTKGMIEHVDHLVGALIVVVSILSFAEIIRALRFLNMALACLLIVFSLVYMTNITLHLIVSISLIVLSIRKGKIKGSYGALDKIII